MRKSIKRAAVFLFICCTVFQSFIGYGMASLPDEISVAEEQALAPNAPYTAEIADTAAGNRVSSASALESPENGETSFQLLRLFPVKTARTTLVKRSYVTVGGTVFGIKLYTRGVLVAKTDTVITDKGNENPTQLAGLRGGDLITAIDGAPVSRKKEVADLIENCGGTPLRLTVERGGGELQLELQPVRGADGGKYMAGLWIRDSSAGIGTVTFYDEQSNTVAGLGHAICDVDSGEIIPISGGELVAAKVMGCYKGVDGTPGELCGVFEEERLARLTANGETGVYGHLAMAPPADGETLPVALKSEIHTGPAQILATVDGNEAQYYDVEITKVSANANARQKNMTIRVTDPRLIASTGGIVQGMSGCPLVQNGMLAGAVTHVFVNSPLEGYAIFAQTMLETARDRP
ncbi:MAG: SpoIVB peptidase [Oscillospiraceae bacterium]|nr:SpoIVB peptidase [Oscillospiraceae bacterium]